MLLQGEEFLLKTCAKVAHALIPKDEFRMSNGAGLNLVNSFLREKLQSYAAVGGLGAAVCSSVLDRGIFVRKPVLRFAHVKQVKRSFQKKWRALACGGVSWRLVAMELLAGRPDGKNR